MIKRFEDEFPETRLAPAVTSAPRPVEDNVSQSGSSDLSVGINTDNSRIDPSLIEAPLSDDEDGFRPSLSRHNSDVSLASRALSQEEGRMHRFGQKFRRDILKPELDDGQQGNTTPTEPPEPEHLQLLRTMVEELKGEDIKAQVESRGPEAVIAELGDEASVLRQHLKDADPENWDRFVQSQKAAQRNSTVDVLSLHSTAVE